jgi:hypothetical protein
MFPGAWHLQLGNLVSLLIGGSWASLGHSCDIDNMSGSQLPSTGAFTPDIQGSWYGVGVSLGKRSH